MRAIRYLPLALLLIIAFCRIPEQSLSAQAQMSKPILEGHVKDRFTGDGSTKAFTLSFSPTGPPAVLVFLNGEYESETDDYTIVGKVITFVAAPEVGAAIRIVYTAQFNG